MQESRRQNENPIDKEKISIQTKDKVEAAKAYIESFKELVCLFKSKI